MIGLIRFAEHPTCAPQGRNPRAVALTRKRASLSAPTSHMYDRSSRRWKQVAKQTDKGGAVLTKGDQQVKLNISA